MLIVNVSSYFRDAPAELLRERDTENAPGIDRTQRDLEKHSRDCNRPSVISSHKFLLSQRHYYAAVLRNGIVGSPVDAQVRHDRFRRSMSQPL
jgi:hypothetical protein